VRPARQAQAGLSTWKKLLKAATTSAASRWRLTSWQAAGSATRRFALWSQTAEEHKLLDW